LVGARFFGVGFDVFFDGFFFGVAGRRGTRFLRFAAFARASRSFFRRFFSALRRRFSSFLRRFASFLRRFSSLRRFFFLPMTSDLLAHCRGAARRREKPRPRNRRNPRFIEDSRTRLNGCMLAADDSCVSAFTSPRRGSAFAVIVRRSHVLLVRPRRKKRWQLPGGGMKRRETPREAARREVDEETGLVAEILGVTGIYRRSDGSPAIVFAATVAAHAEPLGPRNEIREQRWTPIRDAMRLLPRRARRRLADALAAPASWAVRARRRIA